MKPVDQTILAGAVGEQKGDCFRACVASLLEMQAADIPHFMEMPGDWYDHFCKWLDERGMFSVEVKLQEPKACVVLSPGLWCILSGDGGRGCSHSVVGRWNGEHFTLEHDPHPSRSFLGNRPPEWGLFIGHHPLLPPACSQEPKR